MLASARRDAGQEQADHDGVVVRAADEREQRQRVQHRQHEGGAGVATERAGQLGDAVGDECDAGDRLQPQQQHGTNAWCRLSEADQPASNKKSGP